MKNKIISLFLSIFIILNVIPVFPAVFAVTPADASGTVGAKNEITWTFTSSNGRLVFKLNDGYTEGKIPSYSFYSNSTSSWSNAPWNMKNIDYRPYVKTLSIQGGITSIGANAFTGMYALNSVSVYSVTEYGDNCFRNCPKLKVSHLLPMSSSFIVNSSSYDTLDIMIGESAFKNSGTSADCFAGINIGSSEHSVNSYTVEDNAFANSGIDSLYFLANEVYLGESAFKDTYNNRKFGSSDGTSISGNSLCIAKQITNSNIYLVSSPAEFVSIGANCFKNAYLYTVSISVLETLEISGGAFVNCQDVSWVDINSLGGSTKIVCPDATLDNPAISINKMNHLNLNFSDATVTIPEYTFAKMNEVGLISLYGNITISKNNFLNTTLASGVTIEYDSLASNILPHRDLISGIAVPITVVGRLSSNIHKYAIENNFAFKSNDNADFGVTAPSLYNFKSNASQTAISFSWQQKTCAEYYIYRKDASDVAYKLVGKVPFYKTSYTDSNLIQGLTYTYRVIPMYANTAGLSSKEGSYQLMDLSAQVKASVKTLNEKNTLSFSGIVGADKYNIYSGTTLVTTLNANGSNNYSYTFAETIKYGKEYTYNIEPIKKYNGTEQTAGTKTVVKHIPTIALKKLTLNCKDNLYGKLNLSWEKDNNATGYKIIVEHNNSSKTISIGNSNTTSYELILEAGGIYEISIYSYRDYQNADSSNKVRLAVMLSNATSLNVSNTENKAILTWDIIAGADKYIIERYDGNTWSILANTTSLKYTDSNLLYGMEYKYRVCGLKTKTIYGSQDYKTEHSNIVAVKPLIVVGDTVLSLSKTSKDSVTLAWTTSTNATEYKLYKQIGTNGELSLLTTTSSRTYTDNNLEYGKTYQYVVRPYRDYCTSAKQSNIQTYTTLSRLAPVVSVSKVNDSAKLVWTPVAGADAYNIYKEENGKFILLANTATTSYIDNSVELGKMYKYKILPYKSLINNGIDIGTYSEESTIMILSSVDAPKISLKKKSNGTVSITWTSVQYATGYILQRRELNKNWINLVVTDGETSYLDNNIQKDIQYEYRVAAECYSLQSAFSSTVTAKFVEAAPSVKVVAEQKTHTVSITINSNSSIGQYEVYKKSENEDWSLLCRTDKTNIVDSNCLHGASYEYKVRIYDNISDGTIYSNYSEIRKITFSLSVNSLKPKIKLVMKSNNSVKLSWSALSGVKYYRIYRKINNGKWKYLISSPQTSFTDKKLSNGTVYYYKIAPIGDFDKGKESNICSITTLAKKSIKVTARRTGSRIVVNWKKVAGASGYELFFATKKNPKFKKYTNTKKTKAVMKKTSKNNTYYCFVRPYKTIANKKIYGKKSYVAIIK